jgi:serine protease Do
LTVRSGRTAAWLAAGVLAWAAGAGASAPADAERARIESAIDVVRPALVQLTVVAQRFADGRAVRYPSAGSGVVVTAEGHVLTNYHVAGKSVRIRATLASGEELPAEVVAHDPLTDLSVLRLAAEREFTALEFADGEVAVGTPVLALGNPLSLASTVTLGIVSNARRVFTDFTASRLEDFELEGEPTGLYTLWLQHDALILPGNSGGPLVDLDGRIVGINELGGSGIGFAIPAPMARRVLNEVLRHGRVRRADLGLAVLPVTKTGRTRGALVSSVLPGSPAERAGVAAGDVLLAVAGEPVDVRHFEEVPELYRRISELAVGSAVAVIVEREGARRTLAVTPGDLDESPGAEAEVRPLGIAVQELSPSMARLRRLAPRSGLLVTSLRAGGPAALAKPQLAIEDLLTAVGGRAVTSIGELSAALAAAPDGELLLALRRDDAELLAVASVGGERGGRTGGELPKAWLGVETQVVTRGLAAAIERPALRGFRITRVLPWSEAERAGLAVGDVVTALDGERLAAEREQDVDNLRRAVEERDIGQRVALEVDRGGSRLALETVLEARPKTAAEVRSARLEELGFAVRDLTRFDRVELHLGRDERGVLVTEIVPGGWAQMGGLQPDDLVLSMAGERVEDAAACERGAATLGERRPAVVTLFVRRGPRTHFVFLEPAWNGAGVVTEAD